MQAGIVLAEQLTPAMTAGDPRLIESLVANLIDNAIRHNHADGQIKITTETYGTQSALTVTNSGPIIPDTQLQRLFQPFQKLAPDRHGRRDSYGLGLAIVSAVAHAHQATLTTRARPEGGLSITVRFAQGPITKTDLVSQRAVEAGSPRPAAPTHPQRDRGDPACPG